MNFADRKKWKYFQINFAVFVCFQGANQPYTPPFILIRCPGPLKGRYVTVQKINAEGGGPRDVTINEVTFYID